MTGDETSVLATIAQFGPAPIRFVCQRTGLPRRTVESAVESLRLAGQPIIGGPAGLHIASDTAQLREYVDARRRRLASVYAGTRALRRTLASWKARDAGYEAQGTLWAA